MDKKEELLKQIATPYLKVEEARKIVLDFQEKYKEELSDKIIKDPSILEDILCFNKYVIDNKWEPFNPQPRQACFMWDKRKEILYGGSARGGKTVGIGLSALEYVDCKDYAALIITQTLEQSKQHGGIINLFLEWELQKKGAVYNASSFVWTFPSGAKIQFGYLKTPSDVMRYKSTSWSAIFYDELTNFASEDVYTYLFSRLSQSTYSEIPIKMRAASNPDGPGHDWVKNRFINSFDPNRLYMPARLWENFGHNRLEYKQSLSALPEVLRKQLEDGDWDVVSDGQMFKISWFNKIEKLPDTVVFDKIARYWDLAGSAARPGKDPDYSVGAKIGHATNGNYYILDIVRFRETPGAVRAIVHKIAEEDGEDVWFGMEQEGGQSGKEQAESYAKEVFKGFKFTAYRSSGSKINRAEPLSSAFQNGLIYILVASWNIDLLNEFTIFPLGAHDDIVDACSGAFNMLKDAAPSVAYTLRW